MNKFLMAAASAGAMMITGTAIAQGAPKTGAAGHNGRGAKMMTTEARPQVAVQVQRMFTRLDADKNGFLTKAEADAAQSQIRAKVENAAQKFDAGKMFARLDVNHDGNITQAEADSVRAAHAGAKGVKAGHAAAGLFARADTNKDGIISRPEFDVAAGQMKARMEHAGMARSGMGERMFATADLNKDGQVSLVEAQQAALQHFDRADINHDGQLTPQERQQARQQMRAQRKS